MQFILKGRCIVEGMVEGEVLKTNDCISFMGTVNPKTGQIIERKHEIEGEYLRGKILVFPVLRVLRVVPICFMRLSKMASVLWESLIQRRNLW